MLNTKAFGERSELQTSISAADGKIKLPLGHGLKFKMPADDHFYITVRNGGTREYMKVTSVEGDTLFVERGADNTTPAVFPKGSCVLVEWNPAQLCEFVQGCVSAETKAKITPQTVCWTCDTCVEIDEGGHIIKVNGGSKC